MTEKKLLNFIFDLLEQNELVSKNMYQFLSLYLSEPSHSFGFKPLDDFENDVLDQLDTLYGGEVSYSKYECFLPFQELKNKNFEELDLSVDNTKKLFFIIIDMFEQLSKLSHFHGKQFSTLLEEDDISPSTLFDFQPIYKLMDNFITKFDEEIIGEINGVYEINYEEDYGIMYNFLLRNSVLFTRKYITCDGIDIYDNEGLYEYLSKK